MRCKIYEGEKVEPWYSAEQTILAHRGIPLEDQKRWLEANEYEQFGWDRLQVDKVETIINHIAQCVDNDWNIFLPIDADQDGSGAGTIFINYMYDNYPDYTSKHVRYAFHDIKAHGLKDMMDKIPEDTKLVFVTDAGTNDVEEHNILIDKGMWVDVADHHPIMTDISDSKATILNVQIGDYPDKNLTGGGLVYKLVQAYDEYYGPGMGVDWLEDVAAIADCGDMADYRNFEIRSLVYNGLNHLNNKFYKALAEAHDYGIQKMNGLNYHSCSFYICPFINSVHRCGTLKEKEFVFKGSLLEFQDQLVEDSRRGHSDEKIPWYQEAVNVCERVKRRQTQLQNDSMEAIEKHIQEENLNDDSILVVRLDPSEAEQELVGLLGNKLQSKYQKPALVLRKYETDEGVSWKGSGRNYSQSDNQELRSTINATGLAQAEGHEGAFGAQIDDENVDDFIQTMDSIYEDVDQTPTYWIDYSWTPHRTDRKKILEIADLNIYGQGIPESLVEIHDIDLSRCQIRLMGQKRNTIKITLQNGVAIMFFQKDEDFYNSLLGDDKILSIVGSCHRNEWQGTVTPQIIADDYDLEEGFIF